VDQGRRAPDRGRNLSKPAEQERRAQQTRHEEEVDGGDGLKKGERRFSREEKRLYSSRLGKQGLTTEDWASGLENKEGGFESPPPQKGKKKILSDEYLGTKYLMAGGIVKGPNKEAGEPIRKIASAQQDTERGCGQKRGGAIPQTTLGRIKIVQKQIPKADLQKREIRESVWVGRGKKGTLFVSVIGGGGGGITWNPQ